jgi:hypothetical protein
LGLYDAERAVTRQVRVAAAARQHRGRAPPGDGRNGDRSDQHRPGIDDTDAGAIAAEYRIARIRGDRTVRAAPAPAHAAEQQSATFSVPLNLTGLSPDIGVVRVTCTVVGAVGHSSITVIDGKVVTKATIKVVLDAPDGGRGLSCSLDGYSGPCQPGASSGRRHWRSFCFLQRRKNPRTVS